MTLKNRMIEYLYTFFRKKMLQRIRNEVGVNLRCVTCNTWEHSNILDGFYNVYRSASYNDVEFGYVSICGRCGEETIWNCSLAPIAIPCDKTGTPL